MYSYEDHMMHDAWYFVDEPTDTVHMFHLAEPLEGGPSFVGHAISRDLVTWERLPTALRPGPPGSWDDLRICTGSVIERDGRYWMAYSATSLNDSTLEEQYRVQRAGMAVSDDLITWTKLPENPVTEAVAPHYELMGTGQRKMHHWRDPYLFDDGDAVFQLVCARRDEGPTDERGTVAIARSQDMRSWETLPPLEHDRISDEMEVPQLYNIGGLWYLVFCTLGTVLDPRTRRAFRRPPAGTLELLDGRRQPLRALPCARYRPDSRARPGLGLLRRPTRRVEGQVVPARDRQGRVWRTNIRPRACLRRRDRHPRPHQLQRPSRSLLTTEPPGHLPS